MVRLKILADLKPLFREYGRMENQESEKQLKFSKQLYTISFPQYMNRFVGK